MTPVFSSSVCEYSGHQGGVHHTGPEVKNGTVGRFLGTGAIVARTKRACIPSGCRAAVDFVPDSFKRPDLVVMVPNHGRILRIRTGGHRPAMEQISDLSAPLGHFVTDQHCRA
ncbi:MAG: hypothetical protein WA715_26395 [Candidatus Acidiferrum sp.]|jgi:hypothetical protein